MSGSGRRAFLFASTALIFVGSEAQAQASAPPPPEAAEADSTQGAAEIIVTAQRRSENIQKIPIAIQAIGSEQLETAGIRQIAQLSQLTPSFVYSSTGPEPTLSLRGIGGELAQIAGEPSVSLALDGVPLLRQQYFLGSFFDVDRIEVLRGPQGTIAGRNATGGVVNIITRRPTFETQGAIDLTYGNYDTFNVGMWASGPVSDKVAAHFAVERRKSDGFLKSSITGQRYGGHDDILARASILARPSDSVELLLSGDYYHSEDNSPPMISLGIATPGVTNVIDPAGFGSTSYYDPKTHTAAIAGLGPNTKEIFTAQSYGVNFQASIDLSSATQIKSVTGYRRLEGNQYYESSRSAFVIDPIGTPYNQRQFTQELVLTSSIGDDVDVLAGAQYIDEDARENTTVIYFSGLAGPVFNPPIGFNLTVYDRIKLQSYAAFGQVQWRFLPTLELTLGGRYTRDKKQYTGDLGVPANSAPIPGITIRQSATFNSFTPRMALNWKPSADVTAYASVSKGFKAGGFGTAAQLIGPGYGPFKPETVWNYEAGIKTNLFDRRVTANLTAFWADYTNLQFPFFIAPATIINNAGKARVRGIELELGLHPVQNFDFGFNATYLDAKYLDFVAADPSRPSTGVFGEPIPGVAQGPQQLAGNSLTKAPKFSIAANSTYRIPLGGDKALSFYGDVKYQSRIFFSPFENSYETQKGYALVNLTATFDATPNLSFSIYGRNVLDKGYYVGQQSLGLNLAGIDPRIPAVPGNPLAQLVATSEILAVVGEPATYGLKVRYSF